MSGADDPAVQTQVVANITAASYTATPAATPHPAEKDIVQTLNEVIQAPENSLSNTLDATYRVVKASLTPVNASEFDLLISVKCECASEGSCCNVEHTFVRVTQAMKERRDRLLGIPYQPIIPPGVLDLRVECFDHGTRIGILFVSWATMKGYLLDAVDANLLGWSVQRDETPSP